MSETLNVFAVWCSHGGKQSMYRRVFFVTATVVVCTSAQSSMPIAVF